MIAEIEIVVQERNRMRIVVEIVLGIVALEKIVRMTIEIVLELVA
jgi:hypothetical protein